MLLLITILTSLILKASAQCSTCGDVSQVACISEDQYFRCLNGNLDYSQIFVCPSGSVCRNVPEICDEVSVTLPSCEICGICNSATGYSCNSQTTYFSCSEGIEGVCPSGTICHTTGNLTNPCTSLTSSQTVRCSIGDAPATTAATSTSEPTSSTSSSSSTPVSSSTVSSSTVSSSSTSPSTDSTVIESTTSPITSSTTTVSSSTPGFITSPQSFCRSNSPGFYKNPNDSYCRTYIYCYRRLGMRGMLMTCNGNYIFNPTTRSCVFPGTYVCPTV